MSLIAAAPIVIGAGPAGIRAAVTLVAAGLRPVVLDEQTRSGGQIYRRQPDGFRRPYRQLYGFEAKRAQALHDDFDALGDRLDYRPNTLVWNLYEGRKNPAHRGKRMAHGIMMIAADAGFVATGLLAPDSDNFNSFEDRRGTHRAVALTLMGVATASYLMMLFSK